MRSNVQKESLCRPRQTLVLYQSVLRGGLLVATKELFLKNRCCSRVQLTLPTASCNCVSLENMRSLEQRSFSLHLHRYRKTISSESLWLRSVRSTVRIGLQVPGKRLLIPVKLTVAPRVDHFVHLSTPIFPSLFSVSKDLWACSSAFLIRVLLNLPGHCLSFPQIRSCYI